MKVWVRWRVPRVTIVTAIVQTVPLPQTSLVRNFHQLPFPQTCNSWVLPFRRITTFKECLSHIKPRITHVSFRDATKDRGSCNQYRSTVKAWALSYLWCRQLTPVITACHLQIRNNKSLDINRYWDPYPRPTGQVSLVSPWVIHTRLSIHLTPLTLPNSVHLLIHRILVNSLISRITQTRSCRE